MEKKYMAYVGSYTYNGKARGITVFDVDTEKGSFSYHSEVQVDNSSYLCTSHNGKYLYSISDDGVVSFRIESDGSLTRMNSMKIQGMRGCHVATDPEDRFIFVSGYHDGKETVLRLLENGEVGDIVSGIYHKGLGTVAERTFRPHVSCGGTTPDGQFALVADLGLDQVKIYSLSEEGKMALVDAIRCDMQSAPSKFVFSDDGRFLYLIYEVKNAVDVYEYSYRKGERAPEFTKIQSVPTTDPAYSSPMTAAVSVRLSPDAQNEHVYCSNAGDNSVCVYNRDPDTGILTFRCCLPVAGEYPKDVGVFPDGRHIVAVNHTGNSLTFFAVDYDNGLLVMKHREIGISEPNCCIIVPVPEA
ncbi:MAG: lactonase family protein [Clostridium sp.]|nr:lactonase family protein [Clostridium sp.]